MYLAQDAGQVITVCNLNYKGHFRGFPVGLLNIDIVDIGIVLGNDVADLGQYPGLVLGDDIKLDLELASNIFRPVQVKVVFWICLLYTSDAADD